jgi:hypothetical protein
MATYYWIEQPKKGQAQLHGPYAASEERSKIAMHASLANGGRTLILFLEIADDGTPTVGTVEVERKFGIWITTG